MAVFVYSTGSIPKVTSPTELSQAAIQVTIHNRTVSEQQLRVIIWNTSLTVFQKIELVSIPSIISANQSLSFFVSSTQFPALAAADRFEVEMRLSNPHMAPFVELVYTSDIVGARFETLFAGELFQDSTQVENP